MLRVLATGIMFLVVLTAVFWILQHLSYIVLGIAAALIAIHIVW